MNFRLFQNWLKKKKKKKNPTKKTLGSLEHSRDQKLPKYNGSSTNFFSTAYGIMKIPLIQFGPKILTMLGFLGYLTLNFYHSVHFKFESL